MKNDENVPSLEVVEIVSVQCNLVDNQYKRKFEVLYTFTPNKSYAYLLNVDTSNLVFLKNTEFYDIIPLTVQDRRPLQVEDKFNLTLLLNK